MSFTVNTIVFGNLIISPAGPIAVNVGTTVLIDCSTDGELLPDIRWLRPLASSSYRPEHILAHNATMVAQEEGRIRYRWTDGTVLQLVISSAVEEDSGTYWCLLNEHVYRAVALLVINSSLLQQNMAG